MSDIVTSKIARAIVLALALAIAMPTVTHAFWPVTTQTSILSRGFRDGHRGLDIAARRWTGVVPIANGTTVFAGWRRNCGGYQVWVSHGEGLYSAYYHLARETSYPGEEVEGGNEVIGYVGTTGCVTGSHLHVEVWRGYPWRAGSVRVNPWNYVLEGKFVPLRYR
ncbi:MAG: M23 family metallopeptidase [Chloroflexota bacterium]|nr:M23 family metallopeptidase [Chloroflexota bacterium]